MFEKFNIAEIKGIIDNFSLEEKISQLIITGFNNADIDNNLFELVKNGLGGLIFFRDNIKSLNQCEKLISDLQSFSKIGLFFSIDQEGGLVERVNGASQVPSFAALGSCDDVNVLKSAQRFILRELKSLGFNMNFSPVLDVNTEPLNPIIGVRSFGKNPELVAEYGNIVIDEHREYNIIPVAKHFPGHGASTVDSHLALPSITLTNYEMNNIHLYPFKKAIENNVDVIMVCHAFFPEFIESENLPASLSHNIISKMLVDNLGFKGLIVTDDLQMNAITDLFSVEEAAVMALNAGVNILLYRDLKNAGIAFEYLIEQVNKGNLDEALIDKSLEKILLLKLKYNLIKGNILSRDTKSAYNKAEIDIPYSVNDLFKETIRIINSDNNLPDYLDVKSTVFIYPERKYLHHYFSEDPHIYFYILPHIQKYNFPMNLSEADMIAILNSIDKFKNVILISYNAVFYEFQAKLIDAVSKKHNTYALIAGVPEDKLYLSSCKLSACSFSYRDKAIESFVNLLPQLR